MATPSAGRRVITVMKLMSIAFPSTRPRSGPILKRISVSAKKPKTVVAALAAITEKDSLTDDFME